MALTPPATPPPAYQANPLLPPSHLILRPSAPTYMCNLSTKHNHMVSVTNGQVNIEDIQAQALNISLDVADEEANLATWGQLAEAELDAIQLLARFATRQGTTMSINIGLFNSPTLHGPNWLEYHKSEISVRVTKSQLPCSNPWALLCRHCLKNGHPKNLCPRMTN
jgi:hypothetical protein